ncbi:MAG: hypothetical protein ACJ8AI_21005 [Rhodopila sp.]
MASETPIHDFLQPRLAALVDAIVAMGHPRDAAVASLIDIVTSPAFDTAAPDPTADVAPQPDYQPSPDVVLVDGQNVSAQPAPGERDNMDFLRRIDWFSNNP